MERLAICAIFKNEARYLLEWIAYHRLIGFDAFVLYDHESTDGGADLIRRSIFAPDVTIVPWTVRPGQLQAYAHYVANFTALHDWVAFIDCDEFIHPIGGASIRPLLPLYANSAAVLLHWLAFGPSGHIARPPGLVIDQYRQRFALAHSINYHVKTMVRASCVRAPSATPHLMEVEGPTCLTDGTDVYPQPVRETVLHGPLALNHYFTKSCEDWLDKTARGKADTPDKPNMQYPHTMLFDAARQARDLDERMARFVAEVELIQRCAI